MGVIQRVLPAYRAAFFDALAAECAGGLSVFAGQPRPEEMIEEQPAGLRTAVRAEVCDNGCGIPEKELPFIFDRYYRARSDAGKQGNGLGLSIVKAILVSHGAAFGVQSAEGHGSDFWFELPAPAPQPDLPPHRER